MIQAYTRITFLYFFLTSSQIILGQGISSSYANYFITSCKESYTGSSAYADKFCRCIFGMLEEQFSDENELEKWYEEQTMGAIRLFVLPCAVTGEELQMTLPSDYIESYAPESTYSTSDENILIEAYRETSDGLIPHFIQVASRTLTEVMTNSELIEDRISYTIDEVQEAIESKYSNCEVWYSEKRIFPNLGDVYYLSLRGVGQEDGLWQHAEIILFIRKEKIYRVTSVISDKRYLTSSIRIFGQAIKSISFVSDQGGLISEATSQIKDEFYPSKSVKIIFNRTEKDIVVERVAVLPLEGMDCNGAVFSGQNIASYAESKLLGHYSIVERRNLERVLDEQKLALSGLIYEKSAIEAGCNVGAQGIIFTEFGCLSGQKTIQLKLVDCQTSELYWSATGVNATVEETLDKVIKELTVE